MKYNLFAKHSLHAIEDGEPQQFAIIDLFAQEDDQMIEEIVEYLNECKFRNCLISWGPVERKSEYCGCCGRECSGEWCSDCKKHIDPRKRLQNATYLAQYNVDCPFQITGISQ